MEFTYQISEDEYVKAHKLARKMVRRFSGLKMILFWGLVVVFLTLIFAVIPKNTSSHNHLVSSQSEGAESVQAAPQQVSNSVLVHSILSNVGPLVLILCFWVGLIFFWLPYQVRRQYRRDPNYQGVMTLTLTADSVALRSTTGFSWQMAWAAIDKWREKDDLLLLRMKSRGFSFVNIRDLPESGREEMRSILVRALPGK